MNELLNRIRNLDGFANFLRAVPFQTLREAATEGPVVILNVSQYRSDAIIVYDDDDAVLIPLPEIELDTLANLASYCSDPQSTRADDFAKKLRQVLQNLVEGGRQPPSSITCIRRCQRSREFGGALPLIFALFHCTQQVRICLSRGTSPDIYISSYTSTLSVLIAARSCAAIKDTKPELLVIADTGQPGAVLQSIQEEIKRIQKHDTTAHLKFGKDANRSNILSLLPQYRWVHFACPRSSRAGIFPLLVPALC